MVSEPFSTWPLDHIDVFGSVVHHGIEEQKVVHFTAWQIGGMYKREREIDRDIERQRQRQQ